MTVLKTHVALKVTHIEKSVKFYLVMFGLYPVKYKSDEWGSKTTGMQKNEMY